jgi:dipeptidyl aminopeptidase/acylaminoacyl peptidase
VLGVTDVAPFGEWPSPVSAEQAARAAPLPGFVRVGDDGAVWWSELRRAERGRTVIRRLPPGGEAHDVLPEGWQAWSAVHEYGGLAFLPVADRLVFAEWRDQRLYLASSDGKPEPLTPEPTEPRSWRYAEPVSAPNGAEVWCIRETHTGRRVRHEIVAVPLDGSAAADPTQVRVLVAGSDFVAAPRPSPDGQRLAWVAWDHPRMPWDGAEIRVADLGDDCRVGPARVLLGGPAEAAGFPEWAGPDALYAVSDRTGWWNLYRVGLDGDVDPLHPADDEFGVPPWQLSWTPYTVLDDGRLTVLHERGTGRIGVLDPADGSLADLDVPWTVWRPTLQASGKTVFGIAGAPTSGPTVLRIDIAEGTAQPLVADRGDRADPAYLPVPRHETFRGPEGREVYAVVYPPRNPDVSAPPGEHPPYVVFVHGGPTGQVHAELDLEKAYFTSRGLGVVDVDYSGSSGYGRVYRERLHRQWGVVDVEDCVAAALGLAERGQADMTRLVIRGGSAGGWTTLAALTRTDVFAAGTSYYGVAELLSLAEDTHDFESRYLDGLVGELPGDRSVYVERAPLSHVDELSCPVLLLQGLDDVVVPPSQSELFRAALARKGIPHAYLSFEGEQHGFRQASTIIACLEAELSFYGQVLGFNPPGVPRLALSTR